MNGLAAAAVIATTILLGVAIGISIGLGYSAALAALALGGGVLVTALLSLLRRSRR